MFVWKNFFPLFSTVVIAAIGESAQILQAESLELLAAVCCCTALIT